MKLRRIEVENFRAFAVPLVIDVDDFTALIGCNDVGKSSILAALTIFLEGEGVKIDRSDGSVHGDPSKVRITCEFEDLPGKIILDNAFETNLADERLLFSNGRFRITKLYNCTKQKIEPEIWINADNHYVNTKGESLLPLSISELKDEAQKQGVELEEGEHTIKAKIRRAIIEHSIAYKTAPCNIPIGKNESKTLWEQILKHLPMCALFLSDRTSSDQDPEAQTPMSFAVEQALQSIENKLDEVAAEIEKHVQDVAERTLIKLQEMNPELANQLKPQLKDKNIKWKNLFKYSLTSDDEVPMDKRGSGVRRLVLLNFFRAEAERKAGIDGGRPIIYAIEEPETSQHPDHQRILIKALLEISDNGGQVLITTHSPGLAGEIPVSFLRLIDIKEDKTRLVKSHTDEGSSRFFQELIESLGMLPDNLVRALICVEGVNDVRFMMHVSRTLHAEDENLPDLSRDPHFAIIPMKGANLRDMVHLHLFKNFEKPEFHIYDHDGCGTYEKEAQTVNTRKDGSKAVQTSKRTMENYIHPEAIFRVTGEKIEVTDDNDYVKDLSSRLRKKKTEVKAILSDEVAPKMTAQEVFERDQNSEIIGWLKDIANLASN